MEISTNQKMINIALKKKPNYVCLVPEKREELTTEGGLNFANNYFIIKKIIHSLKKKNIRTSLFIEPKISDIKKPAKAGFLNC